MRSFSLTLSDGRTLAGRLSIPAQTPRTPKYLPLIVCVPGGSYDAEYFDVNPVYSISSVSEALGIPVVAICRPSYGDSTPLPPPSDDTTWGQQQGEYLNSTILPDIWKEYGEKAGATSVVLLAHSIGALVATVAAGRHTGSEGYPLAGLITSGIGTELVKATREGMLHLIGGNSEVVRFDPTMKDAIMLQLPQRNLADPDVCQYTEQLNKPAPLAELHDINASWLKYWHKYSTAVNVPLMYGISEFDGLWVGTQDTVDSYKSAFPASPRIEAGIVPMAPHCIELSFQGRGWLSRCCGFANECAVSRGLSTES